MLCWWGRGGGGECNLLIGKPFPITQKGNKINSCKIPKFSKIILSMLIIVFLITFQALNLKKSRTIFSLNAVKYLNQTETIYRYRLTLHTCTQVYGHSIS